MSIFLNNFKFIQCQPKDNSHISTCRIKKTSTENSLQMGILSSFAAYSYKHDAIFS
jgi:hypothetical protein